MTHTMTWPAAGVVMGLAWTAMGGSTLYVEAASVERGEGKGRLSATGEAIEPSFVRVGNSQGLFSKGMEEGESGAEPWRGVCWPCWAPVTLCSTPSGHLNTQSPITTPNPISC